MSAARRDRAPGQRRRRFLVSIRSANGERREFTRFGGSSCGHLVDALDAAGAGARISVRPLLTEAAHG